MVNSEKAKSKQNPPVGKISILIKPNYIASLLIPETILKRTIRFLRAHGIRGTECLVLWSGRLFRENKGRITSCIYPKQRASALGVQVDLEESARIHYLLNQRKEFLFAQVHSHPGAAFHSTTDNYNPMTDKPGFFSIVVPSYCVGKLNNLSECAVFEYKGSGQWRKLDSEEMKKRFQIKA